MAEPAYTSASERYSSVIPPLNRARFAKLDLSELRGWAEKWFQSSPAFAMCLNVALLRGEGPAFAAELAKGLTQVPVAQAFHLYRTGGLIPQMTEVARGPIAAMIRSRHLLPSIVFDAVVAAKMHDRLLYEYLLQKIVEAQPDLRIMPTGHAFLHHEVLHAFGQKAADTLNPATDAAEAFEGEIRIAGIAVVRNEGDLVPEYVGHMLDYCDFVLIFGHTPDDGGPEAAQAKFGPELVEILRLPDMQIFNAKPVYDYIFQRGRLRKATHFLQVDADERVGLRLANRDAIREEARRLRRGEALSVPFPQVFGSGLVDYGKFAGFNDLPRLLPPWKDLLYCDDGSAAHRMMPVHNPWLPDGFPRRRTFLNDTNAGLIHFEKANPWNGFIKTDYYIAKELVHYKSHISLVLSRYLPPHLLQNVLWDAPPPPHPLAAVPHAAYARPVWQLDDVQALAPHIPPEVRFLFNLDYWD